MTTEVQEMTRCARWDDNRSAVSDPCGRRYDNQNARNRRLYQTTLLNQGKAAGPNLIPPEALKADVDPTATFLCPLFAKVWTSGKYPIDWKEGHLVKIPKET
ncbi:hypothetical protein ElyMa_003481900 [Elysia marginata]|uniref:Uncharacterized protein n=1 Tax=Elysia marginata TaxID=1093978 RepID=A0AAV4ECD9_9GAST|nr:hypothetical protein ElyMa_003481900 [Elysia marginata]